MAATVDAPAPAAAPVTTAVPETAAQTVAAATTAAPAGAPATGAAGAAGAPHSSASLYAGNLSPDITEATLFEIFNQVGQVASIRVCRDVVTRRSLGYAYINFHKTEDAERALDTLNYSQIKGRSCRIMWSQRDPTLRKTGVGNVFIKNLDKSIDNKALHDAFSPFGNILSCKVVADENGVSRGYGFVHFESAEAAQSAIQNYNGVLMNGQKVFVGAHVSRRERESKYGELRNNFTNVYVKNLGESVTAEELLALFAPFGPISSHVLAKDVSGKSRGFGFVNFEAHDHANKAVEALHNTTYKDRPLYVARFQKRTERNSVLARQAETLRLQRNTMGVNLYVKFLAETVDSDGLRKMFEPFGAISSAKVITDERGISRGFGFVCFTSPEDASKALNAMNGKMDAGKPLFVALAQRKEVRRQQLELEYQERRAAEQARRLQAQQQQGFYAAPPGMFPGAAQSVYFTTQMMPPPQVARAQGGYYPMQMFQQQPQRPRFIAQQAPAGARPATNAYGPAAMAAAANMYPQQMPAAMRPPRANNPGPGRRPGPPQGMPMGPPRTANGILPGQLPPGMMAGPALGGVPLGGANPNVAAAAALAQQQQIQQQQIARRQQQQFQQQQQQQGAAAAQAAGVKFGANVRNRPEDGVILPGGVPGLPGVPPIQADPLAAFTALLAQATPEQQKNMIGERIYEHIYQREPEDAGKLTGMLLEFDNTELVALLQEPEALNARVDEALSELRVFEDQQKQKQAAEQLAAVAAPTAEAKEVEAA
jgi:polyadenylate-binding protein